MRRSPDDEETARGHRRDERSAASGQAVLLGLHRALLFGKARGRTFFYSVRLWAPGAATTFASLADRLRRLPPSALDVRLRRWFAPLLRGLAGDLERGEHGLVPFLRDLERRHHTVTALMREEARAPRIADLEARARAEALCGALARDDRAAAVRRLRAAGAALSKGAGRSGARPALTYGAAGGPPRW